MPYLTFEQDFTVPRDTESYKAGEVVLKSQASINFFKNLGAPVHDATPEEIAQVKSGAAKPAEQSAKPAAAKPSTPAPEKASSEKKSAKSGASSQAAPASQAPIATSSADLASQPSGSTTPIK